MVQVLSEVSNLVRGPAIARDVRHFGELGVPLDWRYCAERDAYMGPRNSECFTGFLAENGFKGLVHLYMCQRHHQGGWRQTR